MIAQPRLILHADDFGMNRAVTEGILQSFLHGGLTSTSVLANAPYFLPAIKAWKALPLSAPRFDFGVHLNLTQGRPLAKHYPRQLLDRQGRFPGIGGLFVRLPMSSRKQLSAVRQELAAQIERVLATGVTVTHLNGHQYVELLPPIREMVCTLAVDYGIGVVRCAREPDLQTTLRGLSRWARVLANIKRHYANRFAHRLRSTELAAPQLFLGTAHAGRITAPVFAEFLSSARKQAASRYDHVEIGMHPGLPQATTAPQDHFDGWDDPLASVRPLEWQLLTSPDLRAVIAKAGFELGRLASLQERRQTVAAA